MRWPRRALVHRTNGASPSTGDDPRTLAGPLLWRGRYGLDPLLALALLVWCGGSWAGAAEWSSFDDPADGLD